MLSGVKRFLVSDDGPTATEYAIMLSLIVIVCLAAISLLGQKVQSVFSSIAGALSVGA